jgi:tRNA threonylcarbamoyladenosine biosynthesis protein TsaB
MSILLNIDTAVESASVGVARNGSHLALRANENTKEHAGWLHDNIRQVIENAGIEFRNIDAIAVSNGPGSYTGLRIGLSAAKGLCYAAGIPLITVGTLEIMAAACMNQVSDSMKTKALLCPMIDARRMEVYAAIYDTKLREQLPPSAILLDNASFRDYLEEHRIIFFGNGALKWKAVCTHPNALFAEFVNASALDMCALSYEYYMQKRFADLPYAEPLYLKEFYSPPRK